MRPKSNLILTNKPNFSKNAKNWTEKSTSLRIASNLYSSRLTTKTKKKDSKQRKTHNSEFCSSNCKRNCPFRRQVPHQFLKLSAKTRFINTISFQF